jgi:hypothetical protein
MKMEPYLAFAKETIVALALAEAKLTLLPYDKLTPTQKVERDNKIKL